MRFRVVEEKKVIESSESEKISVRKKVTKSFFKAFLFIKIVISKKTECRKLHRLQVIHKHIFCDF